MSASWKFVEAKTSVDNNATSEVSLTLMLLFLYAFSYFTIFVAKTLSA